MKTVTKWVGAILIGLGIAGASLAGEKQKVVSHVNGDDPERQTTALRNIQNHINAVGKENLDLKIVVHGDGVSLLLTPDALSHTKMKAANADPETQARLAGLKDQGVQIQVCANTLQGRKVDAKNDLYDVDDKDIVPSGVAQLAILQHQGYAYIKP